MSNVLKFKPRPYQTAASTIDAFWYVVSLNDEDHLEAWLKDHMRDAPYLYGLFKARKNEKA